MLYFAIFYQPSKSEEFCTINIGRNFDLVAHVKIFGHVINANIFLRRALTDKIHRTARIMQSFVSIFACKFFNCPIVLVTTLSYPSVVFTSRPLAFHSFIRTARPFAFHVLYVRRNRGLHVG